MRKLTVVFVCFFAVYARADGLAKPGYSLVVDCSGCNESEKAAAASRRPSAGLPGNAPQREIDVDVTDFESDLITRYRVTLSREDGSITRGVLRVDVPAATREAFAKALEVLNTIEFVRPGNFDALDPGAGRVLIRTNYPSAFDLIDDNGYQEARFSEALNMAAWPNSRSSALGGSEIGEVVNATLPLLEDYLDGRTALVTAANDGTFIIVEPTIAMNLSKNWVLWHIAENGLRGVDGNPIGDTKGRTRMD